MTDLQTVTVDHSTPIATTFRTQQIRGLFDLPTADVATEHFTAKLPTLAADWQIGLIVGPSGSGKTSLARQAFTAELFQPDRIVWQPDNAVIEDYPADLSIKQITHTLTAVGFSSPPSWLKPFRVLSGGERFRAELARALLTPTENGLVVFDEFTSVVDRLVAKVASAALAKGIRENRFTAKRFIAVSCHYDIADWLTPDWVFDTATFELARGRLQRRPQISLTLHPANRSLWQRFKRFHYLSAELSPAARCYVTRWQGEPIVFIATLPNMGHTGVRRVSRIVTMPDYQGIGIGSATLNQVAQLERQTGHRVTITTSHPAMIAYCANSAKWHTTRFKKHGFVDPRRGPNGKRLHTSAGRPVASFEFRGIDFANADR